MDQAEKLLHQQARIWVIGGFKKVFGRVPAIPECQAVQGVGWLETRYGKAWKGAGAGSNNMGAIQCCTPKRGADGKLSCPESSFLYTDTHPKSDGTSVPYSVCFRAHKAPEEGFFDLCRVVYLINNRERVLRAAQSGSVWNCSAQLRDTGYYEGFGKTREARIANHAKALGSAIARQAEALQEPPMEKFSIDEAAEQEALFSRVRYLMAITLEYSAEENAESARKALLEEAEADALKPIPQPRGWWPW